MLVQHGLGDCGEHHPDFVQYTRRMAASPLRHMLANLATTPKHARTFVAWGMTGLTLFSAALFYVSCRFRIETRCVVTSRWCLAVNAIEGVVSFYWFDFTDPRLRAQLLPGWSAFAEPAPLRMEWLLREADLVRRIDERNRAAGSRDRRFVPLDLCETGILWKPSEAAVQTVYFLSVLWPVPTTASLATVFAWLWSSRAAHNALHLCPCGYDLSATPSTSPFPECGQGGTDEGGKDTGGKDHPAG